MVDDFVDTGTTVMACRFRRRRRQYKVRVVVVNEPFQTCWWDVFSRTR